MMKDTIPVKEAAAGLKVSPRTIWNYFKAGKLEKVEKDGKAFVSRASYEKLAHAKVEATREALPIESGQAIIPLERLEGLLTRLGQLETEKKYLLEYQNTNEKLQGEVAELRAALEAERRRGFWKRFLGIGKPQVK